MDQCLVLAQFLEQAAAVRHILWRWNRDWRHRRLMTGEHLSGLVNAAITAGLRIHMQPIEQRIVGPF